MPVYEESYWCQAHDCQSGWSRLAIYIDAKEKAMNSKQNKEKQYNSAGSQRIIVDNVPYTVMVFFPTDAKESGIDKLMKLARKELDAAELFPIPMN